MSNNRNLLNAFKNKNDEFYTRYEDIEKELSNYDKSYFKDKVIYCPCDVGVEGLNIPKSNFIKYFEDNREKLGYKKLLHTSLQEGFDFRSEECKQYFEEANIVVTNPPFSLFSEFIDLLEQYNLTYIILGNQNAILLKTVFPLIKSNKVNFGFRTSHHFYFNTPKKINAEINASWFTNIKNKEIKYIDLKQSYKNKLYFKYINYDAIEVNKVNDIPMDYDGIMGVPITFLFKYNPNQFEIVGLAHGRMGKESDCYIDLKDDEFNKYRIKNSDIRKESAFYIDENNNIKIPYGRILIKRKVR